MRVFSLGVLILVTACFIIAPSNLLQGMTGGAVAAWILINYYPWLLFLINNFPN
ncbi:MAG: hypothetical protein MJ223_00375 [Mycoplasmoidaceae bacterium]|nr:hypothetical protein [Mycoplasmoidaceae bacterium]